MEAYILEIFIGSYVYFLCFMRKILQYNKMIIEQETKEVDLFFQDIEVAGCTYITIQKTVY